MSCQRAQVIPTARASTCLATPAWASLLPFFCFPPESRLGVHKPEVHSLILHSVLGTHSPTHLHRRQSSLRFFFSFCVWHFAVELGKCVCMCLPVCVCVSGTVLLSPIVCGRVFRGHHYSSMAGAFRVHILATTIHQVHYSSLTP